MTDRSMFIVVEGMDGSGKTGITRRLRTTLAQTMGDNVALTFEPHDPSAGGLFIRDALTKRIKTTSRALALAFALNRVDHNTCVIEPFLEYDKAPRIIISDRYTLSSLVYQSAGGVTMEDVYRLNQWARRPDLTIFLNVSPHNCYARMRKRPQDKELFEKNLSERFDKYQAGIALLRDKGETVVEVDANPTFPEVFASVLATIQAHAPDWLKIQAPLFVDEPDADTNLSDLSDTEVEQWVTSLSPEDVPTLSVEQVNQLFKVYVTAHGFVWGDRLSWTDTHAYHVRYMLPLGIEQSGVAIILDSQQQIDRITRTIQSLLDKVNDSDDLQRLHHFMLVLDNGRFEPLTHFAREGSQGRRVSPQVQIVNRDMLAEWLKTRG